MITTPPPKINKSKQILEYYEALIEELKKSRLHADLSNALNSTNSEQVGRLERIKALQIDMNVCLLPESPDDVIWKGSENFRSQFIPSRIRDEVESLFLKIPIKHLYSDPKQDCKAKITFLHPFIQKKSNQIYDLKYIPEFMMKTENLKTKSTEPLIGENINFYDHYLVFIITIIYY